MTDKITFAGLGIIEPLCRALSTEGYDHPTPIQERAIPVLLQGRDLLGIAETGTGKTAAFSLPILQRLSAANERARPKAPRALVLAPTRELAIQILDSVRIYGRNLRLTSAAIFGGVGQGAQVQALQRGIDVLIATPGRLLDLCQQRCVDLSQVGVLVLDEADRMLDMGFVRDVRKIVAMTPKSRQTLLFSATMPSEIAELSAAMLHNPAKVEIARAGKTVDRIEQRVHHVSTAGKKELLTRLLDDPAMARVIVFTRTKRGANRVSEQLEKAGISADAIHGNKSQGARQKALESFRAGRTRVLVATDIAARGIDIDDITHVVNYELPHEPESYVHRIGRTARAGAQGIAIAFCAPEERDQLRDIERLTRQQLAVVGSPPSAVRSEGERERSQDDRRERGGQRNGRSQQGQRQGRGQGSGRDNRRSGEAGGSRAEGRRREDGQQRGESRHNASARPEGRRGDAARTNGAPRDGRNRQGGDRRENPAGNEPRRRNGGDRQAQPSAAPRGGNGPAPWANWSSRERSDAR